MSSFLAQVAQDIVRRFGHEIQDIAIVFNNQRPITYLKKHLADQVGKAFWSPSFFTIQDLLRTTHPRQEINTTAQLFALYEAYREITMSRGQTPQAIDKFYAVGEVILSDFSQIDYELADATDVFRQLMDISAINQQFDYLTDEQKEFLKRFWSTFSDDQYSVMQERFLHLWDLLPALYQRFKELLRQHNQHTMAGIYRDLAERAPESADPAGSFRQLIFVGFNALNKCEQAIFKQLQTQGKALFYFDADAHYVDDTLHEAGLFIRRNKERYQLINALGEFPDTLRHAHTPVRVFASPGQAVQAKAVSELLQQEPANGKTTAIILADESLLIPVLQSLPSSETVNITMGFPLTQSTLYSLLDIYLVYQTERQTELSQAKEPTQDSEVPYAILSSYLTHPLSGASNTIKQQLATHLADTGNPNVTLDKKLIQETVYPNFFEAITDQHLLFDRLVDLLTAIFRREQEGNRLRVIEQHLIQNTIRQINQLQQGLNQADAQLSIALIAKLVRRVLRSVTAAIIGDPLEGVQIMGLLESRNLNFDRIFLVGANEGVLPNISHTPSFIPYHVRKAYDMPVRENQDALSAYLFYRLFHHCTEFNLLYNALVDNSNSGEPTRFAKQLQYETALPITHTEVGWPATQNKKKSNTTEQLAIPKEGEVWRQLERYLILSPDGAPERKLSASAFTLYLNSPLEFFLKYIARIKEPPTLSEGIEANKLGSVIHQVMEYFYRDWHEQKTLISAESIAQRKPMLTQLCKQALHEVYHIPRNNQKPYTSHQRIVLRLAETYCRIFIDHDESLAPFEIIEMENDTDYYYDFPLVINGQQKFIRLQGIIDRIDRNPDGLIRIVDYKTGRDNPEFKATFDEENQPVFEFFGKNWNDSNKALIQTLYYTLIYEKVAQVNGVEPNLYAIQHLRASGSLFRFKVARRGTHDLTGSNLELAKERFYEFLQSKLSELFDTKVPFKHNPDGTVYDKSPYYPFLAPAVDFGDDDEADT